MMETKVIFICIDCMQKRKSGNKSILHHLMHLNTFPLLQERNKEKHQPSSPHQNKSFINTVFCRNWVVRNPAGTRLDSLAWQLYRLVIEGM